MQDGAGLGKTGGNTLAKSLFEIGVGHQHRVDAEFTADRTDLIEHTRALHGAGAGGQNAHHRHPDSWGYACGLRNASLYNLPLGTEGISLGTTIRYVIV